MHSQFADKGSQKDVVLEVRNLRKTYRGAAIAAVDDVSFEVGSGEIVALLGPSGCGKSTTMRIVAGLDDPDGGEVLIKGRSIQDLPAYRRNVGLVFQDLAIFPHMTVARNVAFGLRMKGLSKADIAKRVNDMLKVVELPPETFADRLPGALSGGQRQRIALARTLIVEPDVVLFDEPMTALDRRLRDRLVVEVRNIHKRLGIPAVYVTHDQESAAALADRIAVMRSGKILQTGTSLDIYRSPHDLFVADFFGDMNCLAVEVSCRDGNAVAMHDGIPLLAIGETHSEGTRLVLGIRPGEMFLSDTETSQTLFPVEVRSWHFNAGVFTCFVKRQGSADDKDIVVTSTRQPPQGVQLWLGAHKDSFRVYPISA